MKRIDLADRVAWRVSRLAARSRARVAAGCFAVALAVLLGGAALGQEVPPPEEAEHTKFVLSGIVVEGSTVYRQADFLPLYKSLLGKEVSLSVIRRVARDITALYLRDGYILSQAIVPPQTIRNGDSD